MELVRVPVTVSSDRKVLKVLLNLPLAANVANNLTTVWFLLWPGQLPEIICSSSIVSDKWLVFNLIMRNILLWVIS
jgi:hypothetical protein